MPILRGGFCADHGDLFGETEEVCDRPRCQAKKDDLAQHLSFLVQARTRNGEGWCGLPQCDEAPASHCERCGPRYCLAHLRETLVTATHHGERGSDVLRLCVHCLTRAEVWVGE